MSLWLPPQSREDQAQIAQYNAEVNRQWQIFNHYNSELKAIDERLMLVQAAEDATTPGLEPGHWHVVMNMGPNRPPNISKGYKTPGSGMFEDLRKGDMWSNRSMYEARKARERAQKAAERQRAVEKEERIEEALDRYRHKYITKISVPGV